MKKLLIVFLCICFGKIGFSNYESVGGMLWYYSVSNGEATITSGSYNLRSTLEIPSRLNGYLVTAIGNGAFQGCYNITSLSIPSSVRTIGSNAFSGCSGLKSIVIPSNVTKIGYDAFSGCSRLESIQIPSSVTTIEGKVFYKCSNLISITLPSSLIQIGAGAFAYCTSLKSIQIPEKVSQIDRYAFYYCEGLTSVTIPNRVTSIGDYAFCYCSGLESIMIPTSVTEIGSEAFAYCSNLMSVVIPANVKEIKSRTFRGCSSLTDVEIFEGVTSIGAYAFSGCKSIRSIIIPLGLTSIGSFAFSKCNSLTSVMFEGMPPNMGSDVFDLRNPNINGLYSSLFQMSWRDVIDENKIWHNLKMESYKISPHFPDGLLDETKAWLENYLTEMDITSGEITLAEGITISDIEQARLLGITPSFYLPLKGDEITIEVKTYFNIDNIRVGEDDITINLSIIVEQGELSTNFKLGGELKLIIFQSLDDIGTEIVMDSSFIVNRLNYSKATVLLTIPKGDYNFFKVLVE